jgi:hypothetical protein
VVFIPYGKGEHAVNDAGQEIDIYDDSGIVTTVRAVIRTVDETKQALTKTGVRPAVDLVAYVASSVTVQRGWKVVWNSTQYEVSQVEDQHNDTLRLGLVEQARGGVNLTT